MRTRCVVCVAALCAAAGAASGQQLDAFINVDNAFTAFVSTDDTQNGTQFLSGNNWPQTFVGSFQLPGPGVYYLHVLAEDFGSPEMFIGRFELNSPLATFSNNTQTLLTNTTDWLVSDTGFGANYVAPRDIGPNGTGPWGNFALLDPAARFLWHPGTPRPTPVYFSTRIVVVPAPGALAMALFGGALLARRRRS